MSIYERVEIVRGATGLLTGAGDPSASINLVRKHAESRAFKASVTGTAGSWDRRRVETDISGALNGGAIRGRLAAKYEAGDTYFDRQSTEKNDHAGELAALVTQWRGAVLHGHALAFARREPDSALLRRL